MRPVGNALEFKLCKIPTIGTQSENQTLPTGNISLGNPIVFSGWALHAECSYAFFPIKLHSCYLETNLYANLRK
ncbi:hypothetical protein [Helicobacter pylori]|uniref:hypothetical protein n=1 Tax=Helicobacter pylori TaxID=210 RepID=UPI00398ED66A